MSWQHPVQRHVDNYLDATDEEELETYLNAILRTAQQRVEAWSQHVIPRLRERLEAELDREQARTRPNVEDGRLGELLGRWNWLGMSARFAGMIAEADGVFRALLSVLRRAQTRLGRLHKGLPLHSLGWLRLPTYPEAAAPYLLAALVEDCIRDSEGFTTAPAAQVLLNHLGRDPSLFDEVKTFVETEIPGPEEVKDLASLDPELLSLVRSMTSHDRSEFLHISLHFDPAIGDLLQKAVL